MSAEPSQPGSSEPKILHPSARAKATKQVEKENQSDLLIVSPHRPSSSRYAVHTDESSRPDLPSPKFYTLKHEMQPRSRRKRTSIPIMAHRWSPHPAPRRERLNAEHAHFSKISGTFGARMLAKMGWQTGRGLGETGAGIVAPVGSKLRPKGMGLAFEGFRERTEQSKAVARRRGEVVSDDEESKATTRKARKAAKAHKAGMDAWKEAGQETAAHAGVGPIIDATGATLKEVSSLAEVARASWTPSMDAMRLPEIRHNLRLITESCRTDLDGLAKEARTMEERKRWIRAEDARLRKQVDEEAELIARMQQMNVVVEEISTRARDAASMYEASLDLFSATFDKLLGQHAQEFDRYRLDSCCDRTCRSPEPKVLRSSARVKAARQKEKHNQRTQQDPSEASSSSSSKRMHDNKGKGREVADETRTTKRTRRVTLPAPSALTINEPPKDAKGKKRAAPEDHSDDDGTAATFSAAKKPRRATSAYSFRPRGDHQGASDMTRKTRTAYGKGKTNAKSKAMMAAAGSSRVVDEDIDMVDAECIRNNGEPHDERPDDGDDPEEVVDDGGGGDDDGDDDEADRDLASTLGAVGNEPSTMSIFGDYRQLGSYMMGISSRLKTMLNNIKPTANPTTRLVTLQELTCQDPGRYRDEGEDDEDDGVEQDEDAALAAALAMSTGGGAYPGDENLEAQVLACRCLANLMKALPGFTRTVVYHDAIPVLCSKLIEISYIELAEQTSSTLEKISEEFPSSIVREGGLAALLNYLEFFSIAVQRTALQAVSNCCHNVSVEHFPMIRGVWP
uniref:MADS box protein n=1 Tax=Ganoderma boninense TaxID=34458 RepID=A0A5K1JVZ2_9APHY|nr:MADS box protein [Ganoderma boninense]